MNSRRTLLGHRVFNRRPAPCALIGLAVMLCLSLATPGKAVEPPEWTQMKNACRSSGGRPASEDYNDWVTGGGCVCPGSTVGSGQPTCPSGPVFPGSSGGYSGGGYTPQQQMILNGAQMMMPYLQQAVHDLFYGNPQEEAARQAAAAQAAEQQGKAEEQYRAEVLRQQESAKQRILGLLKGSEPSTGLALKTGDSDSPLTVTEARGTFGSTVVIPTGIDSPPPEHGLQLKLGDDADRGSMQASQGFDTAGKIIGRNLPPPPPTPTSTQSKSDLLKALQANLDQSAKDQKFLDELQAALKNSPRPDPSLISQVQEKIDSNTQHMNQLTQQIKATEQVTVGVDLSEDPSTKQNP